APIEADVRIIAATNADLPELVASKRFREDLYYRLNVLEISVPPLRTRKEDIVSLSDTFLERLGRMHGNPLRLSRAAVVALEESEWPGNVRQLENILQRGWAVAVSQSAACIEPAHLFPNAPGAPAGEKPEESYDAALRSFQRRFLASALEEHGWNVSETARRIGLARSHLNELIRAHGLSRTARK
ncbi:MAG TPA: sigma 54-interacting transcriptional regulator, partial [Polyangiaceae bacterium]|nr:sigma 54-interacting transcriptional regulator [Polyangiaceae bacterium]